MMAPTGSYGVWVDDDVGVQEYASGFAKAGQAVQFFVDPEPALAAILSPSCAFALIDLDMPHISGIDLIRRVRRAGSDVPFIIVSGNLEDQEWTSEIDMLREEFIRISKPLPRVGSKRFAALVKKVRLEAEQHRKARRLPFDDLTQGAVLGTPGLTPIADALERIAVEDGPRPKTPFEQPSVRGLHRIGKMDPASARHGRHDDGGMSARETANAENTGALDPWPYSALIALLVLASLMSQPNGEVVAALSFAVSFISLRALDMHVRSHAK
jgi:CheY-like chemotaxis protein